MTARQHADWLSTLPFFSGLPSPDLLALAQQGKFIQRPRKGVLYLQGDAATFIYVIARGAIRLFRISPEGHETTLDICKEGDIVGELAIFAGQPCHMMHARAMENTLVFAIPQEQIVQQVQRNGDFGLKLLAYSAQRLHAMQLKIEHQNALTAISQTACFIQHLCVMHNLDPRHFRLPYSKIMIASRLGMESETLSRAIARMKGHGINIDGNYAAIDSRFDRLACHHCSLMEECQTRQALHRLFETNKQPEEA